MSYLQNPRTATCLLANDDNLSLMSLSYLMIIFYRIQLFIRNIDRIIPALFLAEDFNLSI